MYKYSAQSAQPIVAPEFHGIPDFSKEGTEKNRERPELTIVRAPSAASPRLRGGEAEDDGDLMIPDVLRKPQKAPVSQGDENTAGQPEAARFRPFPVAVASAAGLMLVVAAAATIYAAGHLSNQDAGTIAVKTVSLEGKTSTDQAQQTGPDASASAHSKALGKSGFDARFNSAKAADPNPGALKIKRQDRIAKTPLEKTGADNPVTAKAVAGHSGTGASLPVLGYASAPNPHAGWDEGQTAIASAAGQPSLKDARVAAAEPVAATPEPAPETAAASGQMTETSTITADVNLRSAAEKEAPVLTVVPKGTSVAVGSCDNWWCAVSFDGRSGFVGKKFVAGKG
ncbi:SH3 domain-containing protein [uncultured Roseibium sp.]|uniref:SH3 domain-containing protein n=1 Tax=uncultured Roseibium sp. TaxID=1936171 RepID=UPI003216BABB